MDNNNNDDMFFSSGDTYYIGTVATHQIDWDEIKTMKDFIALVKVLDIKITLNKHDYDKAPESSKKYFKEIKKDG